MREQLESLWERLTVCLVASALGFLGGGALVFAAIHEISRDDTCRIASTACDDPRAWLVIACGAGGFALFAVGTAAWFRAVQLLARAKARSGVAG